MISFLIVALLIGIVGLIGIKNIYKINSNEMSMYEKEFEAVKDLSAIKGNLIQINYDIYKIVKGSSDGETKDLLEDIEKLRLADDKLISDYETTISTDENSERFHTFTKLLDKYRAQRIELINYIDGKMFNEAEKAYKELDITSNEIVNYAESYVSFNESMAREAHANNIQLYKQTLAASIGVTLLGFILAIGFGLIISGTISEKIKRVLGFAEALIRGDLDYTITIASKDELGELAAALNQAAVIRNEYEQKLTSNYEEIEASFEEITALESDLREKYQELESSFEETAALEEELREKYSELSISEENLRNSEEWYKLIAEASYDYLWDWRIKDNVVYTSERWSELLGYDSSKWDSIRAWLKYVHPEDVKVVMDSISNHWRSKGDTFSIKYRIKTKTGKYLWILTTGKTLYNESGEPYRSAGSLKDITESIDNQEKLEHMAYHDYLTGLPNRQYMYKSFENGFKIDNFNFMDKSSSVIFIDIDNFKYINDTMGHVFGDELIKLVGKRIMEMIRKCDVLIRLGGDEFILFIYEINAKSTIEELSRKILHVLSTPFEVLGNNVKITASIGIALLPENGTNVDELLKKADIAMYKSKREGKNSFTFFADDMNNEVMERMNIEKFLGTALSNEEFVLYYQPQVQVMSGKITGFEALIRWKNPELGFIPPTKFIPIAEENHMIIDIGNWVLKTACEFIKTIHNMGREDCYISVNVSIIQLIQSDFAENISKILTEFKLSPELLELEITESVFIDSYEIIRKNIEVLRSIGVKFALDDFGKGYSSLSYLKQLPINTLKIDKSFVEDINNPVDSSLVENIIVIGHKMELSVVAEGVEIEEQAEYLRMFKCDKIQGYLYSRPIPKESAMDMIMSHNI